jgi:hypothetical protein
MYALNENTLVEGFDLAPLRKYRIWKAFAWVYGSFAHINMTMPFEILHFDFRKPVNTSGENVRTNFSVFFTSHF